MKQFGDQRTGYTYIDRPGAYAIIFNPEKEIAVVETPTGFFLPGGGIEKGESPEQALRREILEEVGMKIKIVKALGQASQFLYSKIEKRAFNKIGEFYIAQFVGAPGEATETEHWLVWLSREGAMKKLNHEFQRFMVEEAFR